MSHSGPAEGGWSPRSDRHGNPGGRPGESNNLTEKGNVMFFENSCMQGLSQSATAIMTPLKKIK